LEGPSHKRNLARSGFAYAFAAFFW
jgi:hypothetical protein